MPFLLLWLLLLLLAAAVVAFVIFLCIAVAFFIAKRGTQVES